jgi:hypothetical protein
VYEDPDRGSRYDEGDTVDEEKSRLRTTPKSGPGTKHVAPRGLKESDDDRRPVDLKSVDEHRDPAVLKSVDERRRSIDYKTYWGMADQD